MSQFPRVHRRVHRHTATFAAALLAAVLVLPLAGCGEEQPPPPPADGGMQPISSTESNAAGGAMGAPGQAQAAGITWDWPADWQQQTPSSQMRVAQASIPGAAGPADFVVFFFGAGGGGGTDANIERWIGQVQSEPGSEPQREQFQVGDFQVSWVEVEGTLLPSSMGAGPSQAQPSSRLIGAVVEGAGGPWFFKVTGPNQTVVDAREQIRGVIESIEPA